MYPHCGCRRFRYLNLFIVILVVLFLLSFILALFVDDPKRLDLGNFMPQSSPSFDGQHPNEDIDDILFKSVKIMCFINTYKGQIESRAVHVNATWAKRCNKYVFLSYHENIALPYLDFGLEETRLNLWDKIRALFRWTLKNEIDNYDFFLKADDDSYFIMENLRFMLLPYNPDEPLYFGERFRPYVKTGYMSGGAGYVLSREAVRQIVPAFDNPNICASKNGQQEDTKIGICAWKLNFTYVDTRDHLGRHRMLPYEPKRHFSKGLTPSEIGYMYYQYINDTIGCCSDHLVSIHYIRDGTIMRLLDFLLYRTQVFGPKDKLLLESRKLASTTNISLADALKTVSLDFGNDNKKYGVK